MHCANCAARIERTLNALPGVEAAVNFAAERVHIRHAADVPVDALVGAVVGQGFRASVSTPATRGDEARAKAEEYRAELRRFWIAAALSLPLLAQMAFMVDGGHNRELPRLLQWLLATPVQFWIGWRFYVGGFRALRGGSGNMDVLVALGTSMAWGYSTIVTFTGLVHQHVYFEASATVITLVLLGKLLEARAKAKTTEGTLKKRVTTKIEPIGPFYRAEEYHQQYLAKNPEGYCGLGGTGVACPIGLRR